MRSRRIGCAEPRWSYPVRVSAVMPHRVKHTPSHHPAHWLETDADGPMTATTSPGKLWPIRRGFGQVGYRREKISSYFFFRLAALSSINMSAVAPDVDAIQRLLLPGALGTVSIIYSCVQGIFRGNKLR